MCLKEMAAKYTSENMTRQRIECKTVFSFQSPRSLCNCSWSNRLFVLFGYRPSYRSVIIHLVQTVPTWPVLMNNLWLRRGKVSNSVNSEHPFTPLLWYHFPFTPFPGSYYRSLEGGPDGIYPHHHLLREPTYFMVKLIIRGGGGVLAYSVLMACRKNYTPQCGGHTARSQKSASTHQRKITKRCIKKLLHC